MTSVGTVSSTAATALKIISAADSPRAVGTSAKVLGLNPGASRSISPAVSDAILKIQSLVGGGAEGPSPELAGKIAKQDAWYETVDMSKADFEKGVREALSEHAKLDPKLKAALDAGTLNIQRAEDVEGLNYQMNIEFQFGDYGLKQGVEGMSSTFDQDFYQREVAAGKNVMMGWQGGGVGSFYVTY